VSLDVELRLVRAAERAADVPVIDASVGRGRCCAPRIASPRTRRTRADVAEHVAEHVADHDHDHDHHVTITFVIARVRSCS
jgi:hypothetical protein